MWFWETFLDLLKGLLSLVIFCGIGGVIGSFGFQMRRAILYLRYGFAKRAVWRLVYSLVGVTMVAWAMLYVHASWKVWSGVGFFAIMGFFGHFMVPGDDALYD